MPVVLFKSATKQLQEGFHAARQRLSIGSIGKSLSFSDRGEKSHRRNRSDDRLHESFSGAVAIPDPQAFTPESIKEVSREIDESEVFSLEDDSLSQSLDDNTNNSSHSRLIPGFFRKLKPGGQGDMQDSASSFASFLRFKRDSDMTDTSDDPRQERRGLFFVKKRSDVSTVSGGEESLEDAGMKAPSRQNSSEEKRSRIPPSIKNPFGGILKRPPDTDGDRKIGGKE